MPLETGSPRREAGRAPHRPPILIGIGIGIAGDVPTAVQMAKQA
ncbi:hypothetical protein NX02_18280 [Sphingomonas sanxanigenens DSM 19645 = NX02]|uniref:Uncharacterized protein n=1 Tax=Sphingomonas sanxanigenens DSM 19645 = NX02 TaxID=1123269 RepID=W0AI41_9SPHN|nr:hypothetical protein NX02_18280 [Sphingomonas sanxanigenens DSM 19645 = NX02]